MQSKNLDPESRFGKNVASQLSLRGMTQKEFATLLTDNGLALDASAVSRLIAGKRALRLAEVYTIAEALEVSVHALLPDPVSDEDRLEQARALARTAQRMFGRECVELIAAADEVDKLGAELNGPVETLHIEALAREATMEAVGGMASGGLNWFSDFWYVETSRDKKRLLDALRTIAGSLIIEGKKDLIDEHGRRRRRRGLGEGISKLIPSASGPDAAVDVFFPSKKQDGER